MATRAGGLGGFMQQLDKTANYTVTAADNGTLFTTTGAAGAVTFTLPALAAGLRFVFLNVVDQNMNVASAAGNDIFALNDLAASQIAFSTTNEKIGACVEIFSNDAGDKWYSRCFGKNTPTVT